MCVCVMVTVTYRPLGFPTHTVLTSSIDLYTIIPVSVILIGFLDHSGVGNAHLTVTFLDEFIFKRESSSNVVCLLKSDWSL